MAVGHQYPLNDIVAADHGGRVVGENVDFLVVHPNGLDYPQVYVFEKVLERTLELLARHSAEVLDLGVGPVYFEVLFECDIRGGLLDEEDREESQNKGKNYDFNHFVPVRNL